MSCSWTSGATTSARSAFDPVTLMRHATNSAGHLVKASHLKTACLACQALYL